MEILWISARTMGVDLADSTENGLIDSINDAGHNVTLISPGKKENLGNYHLSVKSIQIPGLITISGSFDVKRKLREIMKKREFDLIIIDWRYVSFMEKMLKKINIPWFIMDRGPPTKRNWRLGLQKRMWKRSWKVAKKHAVNGIVVSLKHNDFIKNYAKVDMPNIVVKSGSSQLKGASKKTPRGTTLDIVYIGQIDKERDIQSILSLKAELEENNIINKIKIIGEGDYYSIMKLLIKPMNGVSLFRKKGKDEVEKILNKSHVGVLPMPKTPIWEIASPIKLVEYSRFGLITVGPRHSGNKWEDCESDERCWEFLSDNEKWWVEAVEKIQKAIAGGEWEKYSKSAINDSGERTWRKVSKKMIREIEINLNYGKP